MTITSLWLSLLVGISPRPVCMAVKQTACWCILRGIFVPFLHKGLTSTHNCLKALVWKHTPDDSEHSPNTLFLTHAYKHAALHKPSTNEEDRGTRTTTTAKRMNLNAQRRLRPCGCIFNSALNMKVLMFSWLSDLAATIGLSVFSRRETRG